ncbi:MAG: zinc-finger domain-containing protein [Pseudomonadota bacterium]|nr:zinc-finger domain-containing protein [Pseudomonadota bacterium]
MKVRKGKESENLEKANAQTRYKVNFDDIPLSCPMPEMYLWNSHPKVFLPIEETGEAKCPYCGAEFYLEDKS